MLPGLCWNLSIFCKTQLFAFVQEADQKLLARLAEQEAQDQHIQSARREKAKADAAWMKKVSRRLSVVIVNDVFFGLHVHSVTVVGLMTCIDGVSFCY